MFEGVVGTVITNLPITENILWEIPFYFNLCQKADTYYESPPFHYLEDFWRFRIYPNGEREKHSVEFLGLYIRRLYENSDDSSIYGGLEMDVISDLCVCFKMGIMDGDSMIGNFHPNLYEFSSDIVGYSKCIRRQYLMYNKFTIVPGGVLTITFVPHKFIQNQLSTNVATQTEDLDGVKALSLDFQSLLNSEQKCDVTIKVNGRVFRAHKLILEIRSSVFAAMFKHDMKERNTGVVTIDDCDPDIFQDFLSFIYTGKIDNLHSGNVAGLYALANKYNVNSLMQLILIFMKENLDLNIVCDVVAIADRFNETELKETASKLLLDNLKTVILTNNWIQFIRENPELATEILKMHMSKEGHGIYVNNKVVNNSVGMFSVFTR